MYAKIYMQIGKNKLPPFKLNILDRFISVFRPQTALNRARARATLGYLNNSGFITPGSHKRTMRAWNSHSGSADYDSIGKLQSLREGSRDLVMNTPIASAPLNREVTNAVGWGLMLQSRVDHKFLNMDVKQAAEWERKTEREFKMWAMSKDCDAARTQNFYEQQALAMYNVSLSGDVFVTLPHIKRKLSPYSLSVMILEADMVSTPVFQVETNTLAGGIEIDGMGAPKTYFFRKSNNVFLDPGPTAADQWVKVPAFGSRTGRRNVLHLFHKKRPGQRRGIPTLAPVMETLKQLSRLTEAELAASVINSFFTVFVKHNPVTGGMQDAYVPEESIVETEAKTGDENLMEMSSGNIIELPEDGTDIELADPKRPNDSFEPFFMALVKQMGSCLDIPFEQMILHFAASYSASRAALLEAWKFYRTRRMWLSRNFCQPIYEEWMTEAVVRGRISAPGFFTDPVIKAAWCGAKWVGPGQGQLDPLKESKAAESRLKNRLTNRDIEFAQIHGDDWEHGMDRFKRENDYMEELDIMPMDEKDPVITEDTLLTNSPTNQEEK